MSLVGVDDIQLSSLIVPTMTTLRPNYQKMAESAIDCLQSRLKTPGRPRCEYVFAPDLIVRESSAAPAISVIGR
jgi:DNA-binding LacI/PurR family transcriptional regulator